MNKPQPPILLHDVDLRPYNTFGIHALAANFCVLEDKGQLPMLRDLHRMHQPQVLVLGGGSNILLTRDYKGLVILNRLKGIKVVREDEGSVDLFAASGENWHELVMMAVGNNWGGIENLSLIPGSVGAAPIQNIGAYGVELKDVILSVEAFDWSTGEVFIFGREQCGFGYRDSIFKRSGKGRYFITGITLRLTKNPKRFEVSYGAIRQVLEEWGVESPDVKAVSDAVIHIRRSKLPDPAELGNAGSFFKNPVVGGDAFSQLKTSYPEMPFFVQGDGSVKIPAAWLIEQCGWKGRQVGRVGNHAMQALVIVNHGGATGEEIWQHALMVQQSVRERFGITLEPEVNVV